MTVIGALLIIVGLVAAAVIAAYITAPQVRKR